MQGQAEWFFDVTNVVDCVDLDRSDERPSGAISKEAFFEAKLSAGPSLFKEPRTAATRIYANGQAKALLEQLVAQAGLRGTVLVEPGPRLRLRPAA